MNWRESLSGSRAVSITAKTIIVIALVIADIFMGALLLVLYAWVIALGAAALSCAFGGVAAIAEISVPWVSLSDMMPYASRLLLGVALLGLAMLVAAGTELCRLYVTQILRSFAHWHRNALSKSAGAPPPLPLHPWISPVKRRVMRGATLISLAVLFIALFACFCSMIIAARSLVPWHVWRWFD